ncbi:MAG: AAA family ATPase [Candidatus Thorarchaeota archaeon]|jgi:pilus assembly protein CpaE
MSDSVITVRIHTVNVSVRRKLEEISQKVEGFQIKKAGDKQPTDILIYELGNDYRKDFRIIESLLNSRAAGDIFITCKKADSEVLLRSLRMGAKEFFPQPINEPEVISSFERFRENRLGGDFEKCTSDPGRIVHVLGSKGGVGTTTVAVNLAAALSARKRACSVALVDMNVIFGDIPVFLGLTPVHHWGELSESIDRIDDTFLKSMLTKHRSGIYVLPSPSQLNGAKPLSPDFIRAVFNIMQAEFDVVIVDGGRSLNELSLRSIESADHILLISLLSLPCLSNANKIIRSFSNIGIDVAERTKIVINRFMKKSQLSLEDLQEAIGKKAFWTIPNDYKTSMSAINQGKPLSDFASRAFVTKSITDLAHALMEKREGQAKRRLSLFRRK